MSYLRGDAHNLLGGLTPHCDQVLRLHPFHPAMGTEAARRSLGYWRAQIFLPVPYGVVMGRKFEPQTGHLLVEPER